MILCIANVLDAATLAFVRAGLDDARFADGRVTAGWSARLVKSNRQAEAGTTAALGRRVVAGLEASEVFRLGVLPKAVRPVLFSRYEPGMDYGAHVDDAIMGEDEARARSDVAVTVFLADPADYDGGELVIETAGGEHAYKLDAGDAIAYPATTLHRVEPVTRGCRHVAVTWVQSLVRSAERREILFDLDTARRAVFDRDGKSRAFDLLSKSHANLLRMWAEP